MNRQSFGTVILLALALTGCSKKEEKKLEVKPVAVKTMTVGTASTTTDYNYSGVVEEETSRVLSFSTGGTIQQLTVKVGDHVRRGQLIAVVDGTTARNSLDIAQSTLAQAQDAYNRMKMLHDRGSLPDIKWVEAESQLSQASSAVKIAQKSVSDCRLYAPADGVVSEKYVEVGQNAAPGSPIIKVVSTARLEVRVSIPESEVASIKQGQQASVLVPALGDRRFFGRVAEKSVVADPLSRTYNIKVRVEGATQDLLPGMVTRVSIAQSPSAKDGAGFILPSRLLQLGDDNTYFVWVAEGGKAVRRTVACGEFTASGATIISGLQSGDNVITEGQQKVCTGTRVVIRNK